MLVLMKDLRILLCRNGEDISFLQGADETITMHDIFTYSMSNIEINQRFY